ncbi:FUSC family protein, partial [Acinetobacter baumannii]
MILAAGVTAGLRRFGQDLAIARLLEHMRAELAALAATTAPPQTLGVLGRATDRLALIAQRLEAGDALAEAGLTNVRIAMNLTSIQQ